MATVETHEQSRPPIELHVPVEGGGQINPITELTWCLTPGFYRQIQENPHITDPHLLLMVCVHDDVVERHLVPLDEQPYRLVFQGSGENVLRYTVVWPNPGEGRNELEKCFFDGDYGEYVREPLERFTRHHDEAERVWLSSVGARSVRVVGEPEEAKDGRYYYAIEGSDTRVPLVELDYAPDERYYALRSSFNGCRRHEQEDSYVVEVGEDLFASDPPKALRWLVELYPWWRNSGPRDECKFRGRFLASIPLSIVGAPFALAIGVIALACLFVYEIGLLSIAGCLNIVGWRGISYAPILHPTSSPAKNMWASLEDSRWYKTDDGKPARRLVQAVNPLTIVLTAVVATILKLVLGLNIGWIWMPVVAVVTCFVLGVIAVPVAKGPVWNRIQQNKRHREAEAKRRHLEELEHYRQLLGELVCDGGPPPVRPKTAKMRLSRLGYQLKDSVCKPYAKYKG